MVSELITVSRRVVCVSTSGDDPATTMVSASAPTRMSALIGMTPDPETVTSSRCTVVNPPSENFTTYVPGGRVTMRYWPVPSVTTVRTFSVNAGLEASTVTPGRTAPDESLTTPAIVACANATRGRISTAASTTRALIKLRTLPPSRQDSRVGCRHDITRNRRKFPDDEMSVARTHRRVLLGQDSCQAVDKGSCAREIESSPSERAIRPLRSLGS